MSNLKIAINARLLTTPNLRGWNRYTVNLLAALPAHGVELFLYSDAGISPEHLARLPVGSYQVRVSPPMKYLLWEQRWLPAQCAADRVDLLHSPFNFGLPWSSLCPRVLTLHDAIDQRYYGPSLPLNQKLTPAALQTRFYHWAARRRAHHIIAVSGFTKRDLVKYLHLRPEKVTVVYEAADEHFTRSPTLEERAWVRQHLDLTRPYVFYVGGWEQRKNIPFLLRAFAEARLADVDLVLAGGRDDQRAMLLEQARSLNISERLRLLPWVEEADLPALYAEALCFVYPSEYEGFGLQLCEAMAVGTPILAADRTCLPEILGEGGETFSLDDEAELVAGLRRLSTDTSYREVLVQRARKRSANFSWVRAAAETVGVYRRVAAESSR